MFAFFDLEFFLNFQDVNVFFCSEKVLKILTSFLFIFVFCSKINITIEFNKIKLI